jgi:hypothetical protein
MNGRPRSTWKTPQPEHRLTRLTPWQKHDPVEVRGLSPQHPAVTKGTTVFPSTIVHPNNSPRLLISGVNSRKIGARVTKGRWKNQPIYTLTLVERETCPANCSNWRTCYGNNMHYARRHQAGPALESRLAMELQRLDQKHPLGFVVRLHVLGDFYSTEYVRFWALQMRKYTTMKLFGFTAHHSESDIGWSVGFLNWLFRDRCFIRFSRGLAPDPSAPLTAETIWRKPDTPVRHNGGTVCPAQTDRTDCCGTCTLCWSPNAPHIVFIGHGHGSVRRSPKTDPDNQDRSGDSP